MSAREQQRREQKRVAIPEDIEASELDPAIRHQLSSLSKQTADTVARHLVVAGQLIDTDPATALLHATAARASGGRIGVVREAVGLAAYFAGEWSTALTELRSFRRMTGSVEHFPEEADCERALGRPERAIKMLKAPEAAQLDADGRIELLMVAAGARRDLDDVPAALAMLLTEAKRARPSRPSTPRLWYAYADTLLAAGREEEARRWFALAAEADKDGETDAAERLLVLDGIEIEEGEDIDEAAGDDVE
ncbi:Replicase polyprotein 1ab [Fodinicola acaciae]|uniref:Replicase polyprotein 1ab n=1 Tax=Fodinicola acaciae TaxID=2681555 RepID=UPI0013D73FC4|nr:Replicase polyprotein 1ab [Fodinicola acaciae]